MHNKLRNLRQESGITQKELARKLNSTDKNIWAYENSIATPPIEIICAYAKYFDVSTDYLLGLEDDFGARIPAEHIRPMNDVDYSSEEQNLIKNYRSLNAPGKKLINETIKTLQATSAQSVDKKEAN